MKAKWLAICPICLAYFAMQADASPFKSMFQYEVMHHIRYDLIPPYLDILPSVGFMAYLAGGFMSGLLPPRRIVQWSFAAWTVAYGQGLFFRWDSWQPLWIAAFVELVASIIFLCAAIVEIADRIKGRSRILALGAFFAAVPLHFLIRGMLISALAPLDKMPIEWYGFARALEIGGVVISVMSLTWLLLRVPEEADDTNHETPSEQSGYLSIWQWMLALGLCALAVFTYYFGFDQHERWSTDYHLVGQDLVQSVPGFLLAQKIGFFAGLVGAVAAPVLAFRTKAFHKSSFAAGCFCLGSVAVYELAQAPGLASFEVFNSIFAFSFAGVIAVLWSAILTLVPVRQRGIAVGVFASLSSLAGYFALRAATFGAANDVVPNALHSTVTAFTVGAFAMISLQILVTLRRRQSIAPASHEAT